jgi:AbrB family looped-hinge helix DNA binding protein
MNIGVFAKPNTKGQIVIPKEMRDKLGIDEHVTLNITLVGNGIHVYPVSHFVTKAEKESSYLKLLGKTKGAWGTDASKQDQRRESELTASAKRKKAW